MVKSKFKCKLYYKYSRTTYYTYSELYGLIDVKRGLDKQILDD